MSASVLHRPYLRPAAGVVLSEAMSIVDYGAAPTVPGYLGLSLERIAEFLLPLHGEGAAPVGLGGDHSIALAELRAAAEVHGPLALVLLDDHADVWNSYFGARFFHGPCFGARWKSG